MKRGKKVNSRFEFPYINNNLLNSKRSQLAAFIIIAILIAVVLILIFYGRDLYSVVSGEKDPLSQIKDCAKAYAKEAITNIALQGGTLNPVNYYLYNGNKVEYLCYSQNYYERCVMQKPFIKQDIEKEIENYLNPKITECIKSVKTDLEKSGKSVSIGAVDTNVELVPSSVLIDIKSDFTISNGQVESYKTIKTDLPSKLYDLSMVSSSIINWEARYGDSETLNYMLYYPSLKVEKKLQSDGTTIYILTDRNTLDKFMFASRSVALPPGLFGI